MSKVITITPLLSWLRTARQLLELTKLIEATQAVLQQTPKNTPQPITSWLADFPSPVVELWPVLFPNFPANLKISATELTDQLNALTNALTSLPTASLTIAFSPTSQQTQEYVTILRSQLAESLIVNVQVDESCIGGAQLNYQGKRFSSTLKDRLQLL